MSANLKWPWAPCWAVMTAVVFVTQGAWAANEVTRIKGDAPETVEFFAAVAVGEVEAKLIPRDSRRATVWIENKTDKPLIIRMPVAFAGVPALAQMFPGPGGFPPPGGAAPQRLGFPGNNFPGMDFGRGPGGGPGAGPGVGPFAPGLFNVPAGKTIKTRVDCVCLDHGQPDPQPRVPYKIVALETVDDRPELAELIASLGKSQSSQRVVQVAAWHLANDMTWEQLDALRIKHLSGVRQRWFHPNEIRAAKKLVDGLPSVLLNPREDSVTPVSQWTSPGRPSG